MAPAGYVRFFHALVTGGLLSGSAHQALEDGFLPIEGRSFEHGFALFRADGPLGVLLSKGGATAGATCQTFHALESGGGNGATAVACRNSADLFELEAAGLPSTAASVGNLAVDLIQLARP